MRILIYGAGVIGCFYAVLFSENGYDTTIYARGKRFRMFEKSGLLYLKKGQIRKAKVRIIDKVEKEDVYDFVFLTVKENQVYEALKELKYNDSPNIVTMVNTLESYTEWEKECGDGRILPAFPGAGGGFENEVLHASLTPWLIQPTTMGEINGKRTERIQILETIFRHSHIPYQIVKNMHEWQVCHLAMVVPIADAYYKAYCPERVGYEMELMDRTARRMKKNFRTLKGMGIKLTPFKMNLFCFLPIEILSIGLSIVFRSKFGKVFMYKHSINAPDEMRQLHEKFYGYLKETI